MKYIGADIGKKTCVACVLDEDGTILENTKYSNTIQDARDFAKKMIRKYGQCKAVCESTGNMWLKTYGAFEEHGIPVVLANPFRTRAIAEAQIKTDRLDAEVLAYLLRAGLIAQCYIAPRNVRDNRMILRHRESLVWNRTAIVNRMHSLLVKYDIDCKYGKIHGKMGMQWLKGITLESEKDTISLNQYTRHIEFLNSEIKNLEKEIASEAAREEYVSILMSMTGIDYYSAMLISTEIGDISRFATPKKLVSWAGLCPTIHQSGDSLYHGTIKHGNKKVQTIMVQAANTAARTDDRMRRFYLKVVKRHGHNIAITHVANKMMTIIWHMLVFKKLYQQRKDKYYKEKLKRIGCKIIPAETSQ